jgi:hypothetical protein
MDRLPPLLASTLAELDRGLQGLYGDRFRGLLLYGSYARGEADEGSDVDLLVLLAGPIDPVQELLRMEPVTWPLCLASGSLLSTLPYSFEEYRAADNSFLSTVRREAVAAA